MTTNQQQVGALLKAVIAKGVDTRDAVPTVKKLIEGKIYRLDDLSVANMPASIDPSIQSKLLPKKKSRKVSSGEYSPSKRSKATVSNIIQPTISSTPDSILINRSPVLTLWATIVAKTLYDTLDLAEALTLGCAVAAQMAKAKGTSLGIYQADEKESVEAPSENEDEVFEVLGVKVNAIRTKSGTRAKVNEEIQDPTKTWALLRKRFQDGLGFVMAKMDEAAKSAGGPNELKRSAYQFYMHIRPNIPQGTKGWGAHGRLDTRRLSDFYDSKRQAER